MTLRVPDAAAVATAMLAFGGEVYQDDGEAELCERFLATVTRLFPERPIAVRVLDPRTREPARVYTVGAAARTGLEAEPISLKPTAIEKTRLHPAVAASARLRLAPRWDPPFPHVAVGFAVPLVAAGELYGVLDVGYPLGTAVIAADEPLVIPLCNQLALALRNHRLWRDAQGLRDFQSRLIDHANALIVGIDKAWRITVCNRALLALTGYRHEEVVGRDLRDFIVGQERSRVTAMLAAGLRGESFDAVDLTIGSRSRGRVRTVWSIAAIGGSAEHSTPEAVVAIGQDQTRLRELQDQVIQAERLATLGQLAAGVVHELNNPLTSISVYADYLLHKSPLATDPGDREKLARISHSAQRIQRFTRELVQYAKPVGDEIDVVDLNAVVRQSVSFCEHLFEKNGIALELDLDAELPPIVAIPGQLEQVLINLITNAAHAVEGGSGGGGGTVRLRTFVAGGEQVAVSVADTGPGVASADRSRIFEPFFTTKVDGKGTGLGLPIVRNIVEQHRGTVAVDDATEGGARFTVTLPRSAP